MGIDYDQNSGVQVSLANFADHFIYQKSNKARLNRVIKAVNEEIRIGLSESLPEENITTAEELRDFWDKLTAYTGDPGKYEGDMTFTYWSSNQPCGLAGLVESIGYTENLPSVECVRIFDSYRQHSEMLIGEPVIIYSSDDVWERSLSSSGKKLEKLYGRVYEYSWTDVG